MHYLFYILFELLQTFRGTFQGVYVFTKAEASICLSNVRVLCTIKLFDERLVSGISMLRVVTDLADWNGRDTNFYGYEPTGPEQQLDGSTRGGRLADLKSLPLPRTDSGKG